VTRPAASTKRPWESPGPPTGRTFSPARQVGTFHRYFPFDTNRRDCGDGTEICPSQFVFARIPLEPRVTSDPTGELPGVFVTYNAIDEATVSQSDTSYDSAGPGSGLVGRGVAFVIRSTGDGQTWGNPVRLDKAGASGHQFFPDVDALDGTLVAVWQDNRGRTSPSSGRSATPRPRHPAERPSARSRPTRQTARRSHRSA
jgi:hypothetical protein